MYSGVPSNIPVVDDPDGVTRIRTQYSLPDASLVGHFGAYREGIGPLVAGMRRVFDPKETLVTAVENRDD